MTFETGHVSRSSRSVSFAGLLAAVRDIASVVVFAVLPAVAFCWWLAYGWLGARNDWAFDFRQFWRGGRDVLDGTSPYPSAAQLATAGDWLDPVTIQQVFEFPYPAPTAFLFAPFAALPFDAAALVWTTVLTISLAVAVALLGVRDWRVYGVVFGSAPVIGAVRLGTLTPILLLLLAAAWRWRDRPRIVGAAVAGLIVLKLFAWPLVVWLALTRRWLAAGIAAAGAICTTLAAWALIGFEGLADYPEQLRRLSGVVSDRGFSLVALGDGVGLESGVAHALPWLAGALALAAACAVASSLDGDRRAFSLCIVAAILASPIVWNHYYLLLIAPLALARPRLSWAWLLLWLFWIVPAQENGGEVWRVVVGLLLLLSCAVITTASARDRDSAILAPAR